MGGHIIPYGSKVYPIPYNAKTMLYQRIEPGQMYLTCPTRKQWIYTCSNPQILKSLKGCCAISVFLLIEEGYTFSTWRTVNCLWFNCYQLDIFLASWLGPNKKKVALGPSHVSPTKVFYFMPYMLVLWVLTHTSPIKGTKTYIKHQTVPHGLGYWALFKSVGLVDPGKGLWHIYHWLHVQDHLEFDSL